MHLGVVLDLCLGRKKIQALIQQRNQEHASVALLCINTLLTRGLLSSYSVVFITKPRPEHHRSLLDESVNKHIFPPAPKIYNYIVGLGLTRMY